MQLVGVMGDKDDCQQGAAAKTINVCMFTLRGLSVGMRENTQEAHPLLPYPLHQNSHRQAADSNDL